MRQIYFILILSFAIIFANNAYSQCGALPISSAEKSALADAHFLGKVVSKECRYDNAGNIITINRTEVLQNKGSKHINGVIEIITPGGVMQDNAQFYFPGLNLQVGEQGTFFCTEKSGKYYPVGLSQGFEPAEEVIVKSLTASITSISPLTITAGTRDVITITGSGFGIIQGLGTVSFHNADNGGESWVNIAAGPHYLSWSDTQIKMYVPTYTTSGVTVAGSGTIKVNTTLGEHAISEQEVEVAYALNELVYNGQIGKITLADINNGGYLMKMSSLFAQNEGAENGFLRALNTWRCNTGINMFADTADYFSGAAVFSDGISTVSFDEQGILPQGALALTVVSVSACSNNGVVNWQLREMDMVFNSSALWWTEPGHAADNHFDFESVALHELGHAHLLQHNNNHSSIMYFHLNDGEMKRSLIPESGLAGGMEVMQNSIDPGYTCNNYEHIVPVGPEACGSFTGIDNAETPAEDLVSVFPNPSNGNFNIVLNGSGADMYDVRVYNATGAVVFTTAMNGKSNASISLPVSSGIYFLELYSGKNIIRKKIIVE